GRHCSPGSPGVGAAAHRPQRGRTPGAVDGGNTARAGAGAPRPAPESTFRRHPRPLRAGLAVMGATPDMRTAGDPTIRRRGAQRGARWPRCRRAVGVPVLEIKNGGAGEAKGPQGSFSVSPTPHTKMSGGDLLSHTLPSAVPSAQSILATGFGME